MTLERNNGESSVTGTWIFRGKLSERLRAAAWSGLNWLFVCDAYFAITRLWPSVRFESSMLVVFAIIMPVGSFIAPAVERYVPCTTDVGFVREAITRFLSIGRRR